MKAVVYRSYGGPEALEIAEVARPEPKCGELLVRVWAAALNPFDWKVLRGDFRIVTGWRMPRRIGVDFAGTVEAVGPNTSGFVVGDRVLGAVSPLSGKRGALAEWACAKASEVASLPGRLSFEAGAALPVAAVSARECLRQGRVAAGQKVLVIGATGGVGSFCLQLAKLRGLRVTAVCREHHVPLARSLGADTAIAYDRSDPLKVAERFHLVADIAARYSFSATAHLLEPGGTYVTTVPGPKVFWDVLRTRLAGSRRAAFISARPNSATIAEAARLAADGQLQPTIASIFTLADIQAAYRLSMTGHTPGKIVVRLGA